MRRPIHIQLLLPMLAIVALTIALATAGSVYLTVAGSSQRQADHLSDVVNTLTEVNFPLGQRVLEQMSGLSDGQFVLLDNDRQVVHSTIRLSNDDLAVLVKISGGPEAEAFSARSVVMLNDHPYFSDLMPVAGRLGAAEPRWLIVLYPKERWWAIARQTAYPILMAGVVAILVGVVISVLLAGRFVRPIKALRDQSKAIAAGRFLPVAVPPQNDEIADLAIAINAMTNKLAHFESQVRRNERLRTLGQLGAGMAHRLRNSATGARMAIELHQRECPTVSVSESVDVALRQLRLMESYLQRFLRQEDSRSRVCERVELQSVIENVFHLVRLACEHAKIELSSRQPVAPVDVKGDPEALCELLVNLVFNGIEAAGKGGGADARIIVELDVPHADRAVLRVKDSGPGPAADMDDLFEPFVTEKPEGAGLGLYVARQVAEAHGGSVCWQRHDGMTCFSVDLPVLSST